MISFTGPAKTNLLVLHVKFKLNSGDLVLQSCLFSCLQKHQSYQPLGIHC